MTHPLFDVPNLDGLTIDPAELECAANVLAQLARYARLKAQAMRRRRNGDIAIAVRHEAKCDVLYKALPEWARW